MKCALCGDPIEFPEPLCIGVRSGEYVVLCHDDAVEEAAKAIMSGQDPSINLIDVEF